MNTHDKHHRLDDESEAFESAVWAVVTEAVPPDALQRIKDRAVSLRQSPRDKEGTTSCKAEISRSGSGGNRSGARFADPRRRFAWKWVAGPLAIAASTLVIVAINVLDPAISLAQVVGDTFSRPWVHTRSFVVNDDGTADSEVIHETWLNADRGIKVFRSSSLVFFENRGEDSAVQYKFGDPIAIRTLPTPPDMIDLGSTRNTLEQLLAIEGESNRLGLVVSNVQSAELERDNQAQVDFDMRQPGNPSNDRHFTLVVDQVNRLVVSMTESSAGGRKILTTFDYPDSGPASPFEAGVPQDVTIDDRRDSTDIRQIAGVWSKARAGFDSYDSVYVQTPKDLRSSVITGLNVDIKRVRQMGERYRVDALLKPVPGVVPPTVETDMNAWWIENRDRYYSYPLLVCDGKTVTYFETVEKQLRRSTIESNPAIQQRNVHPIFENVVWGHLMPEQTCRPHLFVTDANRRFEYSPIPDDGLEGTVRLTTTISRLPTGRSTLWLDPAIGFAARENRRPVFDRDADTIAFVDTEKFFDFQQSPSGIWFPTRSERSTSNSPGQVQVRRFYVNFDKELTDDLFEVSPSN